MSDTRLPRSIQHVEVQFIFRRFGPVNGHRVSEPVTAVWPRYGMFCSPPSCEELQLGLADRLGAGQRWHTKIEADEENEHP